MTDNPLAIVLVEDDDVDADLVAEMLRPDDPASRMTLHRATRLEESFPLLAGADLVLLDLMLPDSRGLETLRRLREQAPELPVVVLSGLDDESVGLDAVRNGAQDYIPKGQMGFRMLQRVIHYAVERSQARRERLRLTSLETEVAERRQAEARLLQSERQLAEAQRVAHIGSWTWDIAANQVTWTDETYRIFGRTALDFDGTYESMLNGLHADDRAEMHAAIARSYESHHPFDGVYRIVRNDGQLRYVQARGEIVADASGMVTRMVGTFQDVTDATLASAAALEQTALVAWLMRLMTGLGRVGEGDDETSRSRARSAHG